MTKLLLLNLSFDFKKEYVPDSSNNYGEQNSVRLGSQQQTTTLLNDTLLKSSNKCA